MNFAGDPHLDFRVGMPSAGRWHEVLNTDDNEFGGSGVGNGGMVVAEAEGYDGKPASVTLALPPLGVLFLAPADDDGDDSAVLGGGLGATEADAAGSAVGSPDGVAGDTP